MSRLRLYRSDAVVLARRDFGEADRILTLYTRQRGKIQAIAKGVRRIASRKSGHVELFAHSSFLLARGRNLDVLTQVETREAYGALREDLIRTTYAYHIAELVDRFTEEGSESPAIFELLVGALRALCEAEDPALVTRYFELRFLGQAGYRPELFHCVVCGEPLEEAGNVFSPDAGGVACSRCTGRVAGAIPVDQNTFRVLRFLQSRDWAVAQRIELSHATRATLERVMHAYVRHLLERDLRSIDVLEGLRRVAEATERETAQQDS